MAYSDDKKITTNKRSLAEAYMILIWFAFAMVAFNICRYLPVSTSANLAVQYIFLTMTFRWVNPLMKKRLARTIIIKEHEL